MKFAQVDGAENDTAIPGTNGVCNPHITCYKCNQKGHVSSFCPMPDKLQTTQVTFTSSEGNQLIPKSWIILDVYSSISFMANKYLVENIKISNCPTRSRINDG